MWVVGRNLRFGGGQRVLSWGGFEMRLKSTFRKLSEQFAIEFEQLSREIGHNLTAGEAREAALRSLLQKYLPQRVGIDRGFVIDALGGESKQMDMIIYDKTVGVVFEISGVKYFPCETVLAVGEVKSDITSRDKLQDALEKIRSVKELDRSNRGRNRIITGPGVSLEALRFDPATQHRDQVFGFIFTGSNSMSRETVIEHLQDYHGRTDRRFWMNLFCAHGRYLISYECDDGLYPSAMDAKYVYCTKDCEAADLLLMFYCILATFIDQAHVARPDYFSYGSIREAQASYYNVM